MRQFNGFGGVLMERLLLLSVVLWLLPVSALAAQDEADVVTIPYESLAARMALSPDDRMLAVYNFEFIYDNEEIISPPELIQIRLFDVQTSEQIGSLNGHTDWVSSADFNGDGSQLVTLHRNGDLMIWDVASQSAVKTIPTYIFGSASVQFMPDDRTVLLRHSGNFFWMLDTQTGAITQLFGRRIDTYNEYFERFSQYPERADIVFFSITISPDGTTLASASGSDEVLLWDVATGEWRTLREKSEESGLYSIRRMFFSDDGSTLTYFDVNDKQVHRWDVETGTEVAAYELLASVFVVTPDESMIAWADRETNTIYWAESMVLDAPTHEFRLPDSLEVSENVTTLTFTSDKEQLIVGGLFAQDAQNAIYVIDLSA